MRSYYPSDGQNYGGDCPKDDVPHKVYVFSPHQFILYLTLVLVFGMGLGAVILASFILGK